jgi:hypothetical protein
MNDPRDAWQNQPAEPFRMSPDLLRYKARQRHAKARFSAALSIALGLILGFCFAASCHTARGTLPRLGWAVLSLWSLYFAAHTYRWVRPGGLAPDANLSTCRAFYRAELEKQRDYGLHIWRRSGLAFCFLGIALVFVPVVIHSWKTPRVLANALPFFILLAVWAVAFLRLNKQKRRKLQEDIAELNAFETDKS